jgi:hypothetical protein
VSSRSDAGDTLVELLIAMVVIGLTAAALLGAFATSISASAEHRGLATADTVLKSFAETATYQIQLQPSPKFVACATLSSYQPIVSSFNSSPVATTNGFTVAISSVQNWTSCTPIPVQPPPQLITATATGSNGSRDALTFVVVQPDAIAAPITTTITSVSPAFGPAAGGTSVTITGSGFTGASGVAFGSTPATTFHVVSNTSITATSPAGTGTVDVSVTTPSGSSSPTATDQFTYGPAVTSISPTTGPPAGSTSVTITGSGFTSATAVNFGGTAAQSFAINATNSITAVSPAGLGTVDITVTTPSGTSPASAADQFAYGLSVTGISPAAGPSVGGTSVTISGSGFTGATSANFGGVAATNLVVVSPTSITATSPPGPQSGGTVDVTVTTPAGTSTTSVADRFSYSVDVPSGLEIVKSGVGGTGSPVFTCASPGSCTVAGVGSGGSASFFVDFVDALGRPVVFSPTTPSTINVLTNGSPPSTVIPANATTSSPSVAVQIVKKKASTATLKFTSGATTYNLSVTVQS